MRGYLRPINMINIFITIFPQQSFQNPHFKNTKRDEYILCIEEVLTTETEKKKIFFLKWSFKF